MQKQRYVLLDSLRGIALVNMIAYHAMWDLVYIYGVEAAWYMSEGAYIWQQAICWTFIILSGFCFSLGKKHFRRGITVFVAGLIVSVVTLIFMPYSAIRFGILTCLGSCMLIMIPLDKLFRKIPAYIGAPISFILFLFTRGCNWGNLGFFGKTLIELPQSWYSNLFTAYLGFPSPSFSSSDYFSVFPWLFLFIFGYFLFKLFGANPKVKSVFAKGKIPVLNFLGKHSLIVYMLHQPVIYGLFMLIM